MGSSGGMEETSEWGRDGAGRGDESRKGVLGRTNKRASGPSVRPAWAGRRKEESVERRGERKDVEPGERWQ